MRTLILTVVLLSLIPFSLFASSRSNSGGLAERVAELEAQVEELSAILQFVHVEQEEMDGMTGPHWIIEGANVHVRSGSGLTDDNCWSSLPDFPNCEGLTGLGNLIVGYSERRPTKGQGFPHEVRTGSHNLVVGKFHSYSSFAGFVAGRQNKVTSAHASVSGGWGNRASGWMSSVSGGQQNVASGIGASVSGGLQNVAGREASSVSGGRLREAPDDFNWAAGSLFEPN
jgi:hypothetical protein